jgi:hypothetical protein
MAAKRELMMGLVRVLPGPDRSPSAVHLRRCFFLSIDFCTTSFISH